MQLTPQAIEFLKNYIDKNPYSEVAWHQLGREYFIEKEYQLAIEAFDYATLIDERFIGAFMEKAKCLEKLGKYKKAIKNYMITLELEDPTPFALLRIGKCYEKLGKKSLAIEYILKATNEDPLLQKGWLAIIKFHIKESDFEKALFYTNKAISIDQENAKKISKLIRDEGPKSVKAQIQGDELRVSSKSRDDLQDTIALLKRADLPVDLQFTNFR